MHYPKRLIEVDLPIKRIFARAAEEEHPAWAYFHDAHLVGPTAIDGVPIR